jgi:pimeloyl-ACP methyl ester carboxylesterase
MGREYILGYRALRQLAYQLTRAGFAVLRFDYYGCGDSAGDSHEGSVMQWMNDIETAIEEVKRRGELSKICLVGARLGAALGVLVGNQRSDVQAIALWDPVVDGKNYVTDLIAQHQEWLNERSTGIPAPHSTQQTLEVLGYPLSATLQEGLEQVNLLNVGRCPAKHVLTLESDKTASGMQLSNLLKETGVDSEYQHISGPRVWLRRQGGDNVVVPVQMLQAIVGWVSRITT